MVPVFIGMIRKGLVKRLEEFDIREQIETIQTIALLRSARIIIIIKVSNWKTPGHDGIYGFWFKKFTSIHDRLTLEMNKCLQTAHIPEWMTKGRTTKGPKQRKCHKQLQTHNLPTNNVENINSTNKERNLLLANKPQIDPWRTERMLQRFQRHSRITLNRSKHYKWELCQMEKSSYDLDWLQKGIWYGSA